MVAGRAGHVLFIERPLLGTTRRIDADNAAVARFLQRTIEVLLHEPFANVSPPTTDASFLIGKRRVFKVVAAVADDPSASLSVSRGERPADEECE